MELKELTVEEVENIYKMYLVEDFPPNEVKSLKIILKLYKNNFYMAFGMFEENNLLAYAFITKNKTGDYLLLDYYAVSKNQRGTGIGSTFLAEIQKHLNKMYSGLIIEIENPKFAKSIEEKQIRNKRIYFYEKNNLRHSKITSKTFGVEYNIMVLEFKEETSDEIICKQLKELYKIMISPISYKINVLIRKP